MRARVAGFIILLAGCTTTTTAPEATVEEAAEPAAATTPVSRAVATAAPAAATAAKGAWAPIVESARRAKVREVATSYASLVRNGRWEDARRYLPPALREKQTASGHADAWKRQVPAAELEELEVGALTADEWGGFASIVSASKLVLVRISGDPKDPTVVPDWLATRSQAAPEGDGDWMPIEAGRKETFVIREESRMDVSSLGGGGGNSAWAERHHVTWEPAPAGFTGVLRKVRRERLDLDGGSASTNDAEEEGEIYEARKTGIVTTAGWNAEKKHPVRRNPITVLALPAKPGTKWMIMREKLREESGEEGERVELEIDAKEGAGFLGWETVETAAGRFENCLVLRTLGTMAGKMEVLSMEGTISGGLTSTTLWLARGVGVVRKVEHAAMRVRFADATGMDVYSMKAWAREKNPERDAKAFDDILARAGRMETTPPATPDPRCGDLGQTRWEGRIRWSDKLGNKNDYKAFLDFGATKADGSFTGSLMFGNRIHIDLTGKTLPTGCPAVVTSRPLLDGKSDAVLADELPTLMETVLVRSDAGMKVRSPSGVELDFTEKN